MVYDLSNGECLVKSQSVVSLDPIDRQRKKQDSVISRFFKTRHFVGKNMSNTDPFGHYLFTGKQRQGKTSSAFFFQEKLIDKYQKKGKTIKIFDNMGVSDFQLTKFNLPNLCYDIPYDENIVYIFFVDEIQTWYPKDTKDKTTLALIDKLAGAMDQLGKRQIYMLSTAQVYGKVHKLLREQCLYMVYCRRSKLISGRCVNDFIDGDDILCDDLGRWSGIPSKIWVHGLPKTEYDTHRVIYQL